MFQVFCGVRYSNFYFLINSFETISTGGITVAPTAVIGAALLEKCAQQDVWPMTMDLSNT
jgi:hypothetical protein